MTLGEIETRIVDSARRRKITFDDNMVSTIAEYFYQNTALRDNYLDLMRVLFALIKEGNGAKLHDDRDGKLVTCRTVDKKNMTFHFETLQKGKRFFFKSYNVYHFEIGKVAK